MVLILYQFGGFLSIDARNGYRYSSYYEKVGKTEVCIDDEIPFELPDSWAWVRHNDIIEISGGAQPPKAKFIDSPRPGYIRLYQIRDYGPSPQPIYIPIETATKTTQKGDILLARYGASLGKVFVAEDGAYNVAMAKVIPLFESMLIDRDYLLLFYKSSIYQGTILGHARSAQAGFNKEDLSGMLFPVPPLKEQQRIVKKVASFNPFIEEYARYNDQEKALDSDIGMLLRKSILQYAIQGKLVPQDPSDEPASILLERIRTERETANLGKKSKAKTESYIFKNSDDNSYYPFDIPESWEWVQLSEICEINPAVNDTEDDYDAAFIPMKLIDDGFNNHFQYEIKKWDDVKSGYTHFQNRDVAFAKITPCFENRKSVIMENLPNGIGAGTTELHILRAYPGIAPEYLLWFVKTPYFIDYGKEHFTGTAGQQRFGTKALANMYIPIPPTNEQKRIVEKIQAMIPIIPNSLIMRK